VVALKITPQAAKLGTRLATSSMLNLMQPTSRKCPKTCTLDRTFSLLVLTPNYFKITKSKI